VSDDEPPDNLRHLPRIGSPPPPPVPLAPTLDGTDEDRVTDPGPVRISAFDAPEVPHAPPPSTTGAALRSEGLNGGEQPSDAGAPRAGALSLAVVLAIALAAFEGLQTWIQESGPRRAEAAAHQREMELLAAKAGADATRHGAEADAARAKAGRGGGVQSSRDYGRSALGRGSGSPGRGSGIGSDGFRGGGFRNGVHRGRSDGTSGRGNGGGGGRAGAGLFGGGRGTGTGGGRGNTNGKGSGSGKDGPGSPGSGGNANGKGAGGGGAGRRSPRQAVSDWWGKGKRPSPAGAGGGAKQKGAAGDRAAAIQSALKKTRSSRKGGGATAPTFWEAAGDRLQDRWKNRHARPAASTDAAGKTGNGGAAGARRGNDGWSPNGRVTFRSAVFEAVNERWAKRRDQWKKQGGPRTSRRRSPNTNGPTGPTGPPGSAKGGGPSGPGASTGSGSRYAGPRTSPFDTSSGPNVTITVEQVDPPGTHARRWEPDAPPRQHLPAQGQPVLSRAPQRPAGTRPGTTRRKDPIPMPPSASSSSPVIQVTPPPANAMAGRHATEISLDSAVKALTLLTTAGMETYDDCQNLARQARRLFTELEVMANDLATNHNITGARTVRAMGVLMESVGMLSINADRMAKAALNAAELAEAEETAMERDYRPTQTAAIDAGLAAPSARIHNEN
jgi:Predicted membrane protein